MSPLALPRSLLRVAVALLIVVAPSAHAGRVALMDVKGDKGPLRQQLFKALQASGKVQLVARKQVEAAAAKAGFRGARAQLPAAKAAAASRLKLDAFVEGHAAKGKVLARVLDSSGKEIWRKELPLKKGVLAKDGVRKWLAAVLSASSSTESAEPAPAAAPPTPPPEAPPSQPVSPPGSVAPPTTSSSPPVPPPSVPGSEAHPAEETHVAETSQPAPSWLTVNAGGTATWRSYCSRPGVSSCAAYDALVAAQQTPPVGSIVDFLPSVPYLGFEVGVEAFPLMLYSDSSLVRGLGITGSFAEGFSLTQVTQSTSGGSQPAVNVKSTDTAYDVSLAWRRFFFWGLVHDAWGYVGLRLGTGARDFSVSTQTLSDLPSSHRSFPLLALDSSVPVAPWLQLQASVLLLMFGTSGALAPTASTNDLSLQQGSALHSSGFGFELGASGRIWGPLGYAAHFKYESFVDHVSGPAMDWQSGGIVEEKYSTLTIAATGQF